MAIEQHNHQIHLTGHPANDALLPGPVTTSMTSANDVAGSDHEHRLDDVRLVACLRLAAARGRRLRGSRRLRRDGGLPGCSGCDARLLLSAQHEDDVDVAEQEDGEWDDEWDEEAVDEDERSHSELDGQ